MMKYLLHVSIWVSQTLNVWLLAGHPDQTVSARAYLSRNHKVWGYSYRILNKIFFWQADHCYTSHQQDVERARYIQSLNETTSS